MNRARIKGGLMYEPRIPQPYWAQGPNMIASSQGLGLMPPLGPFGQSDPKWLSSPLVLTHTQSIVPREVVTMPGITVSR